MLDLTIIKSINNKISSSHYSCWELLVMEQWQFVSKKLDPQDNKLVGQKFSATATSALNR